uniref:Uncharacterized protein n=1 Tax=Faxonius propinquus nudivirus TaxID=3139431 RepID=A0AAU8GCV9_9VIRU
MASSYDIKWSSNKVLGSLSEIVYKKNINILFNNIIHTSIE